MVNRIGGAIQLIGLRAAILDIRQYSASGRQIESTNVAIGKATDKAAEASRKSAQALTNAMRTQSANLAVSRQAQILAAASVKINTQLESSIKGVAAAELRLAEARRIAAQARPQDPATGRFISRAAVTGNVTAAEGGLAAAQAQQLKYASALKLSQAEAKKLAAAQKLTAKEASAASKISIAAATAELAANEKLIASESKLALLKTQRVKTVTTAGAIGGAIVAGAVAVSSIAAAAKYESTLTKINVLTGATSEETKRLGQEFLTMSKTIPQTPDELGASAYFILSSGIKDVDEALKITTLSAKASAIGLGESKEVARVLTSTLNAYQGTGLQAAQVTDILVAAVKEGSAEASDFAQSLGRVIPVASNLGVGFDEVAATVAALTNAGLDTSEATTGLLGILNQLQKSTPDAEAALEGVGLTIEGIRKSIQDKGFVATMQEMAVAFSGNTSAIRPLLPEVRGLNAFVSAFIVQGKNASNILATIRQSAGITEKSFDEMSNTFGFQKDLLKNQLNVALIQIGTAVLPTVTNAMKDLLGWVNQNQDSIKAFVTQGLKVAIEIFKDVAKGVGAIIDALSWIPSNEAAIVAAVAAIGSAFLWAMPGGPLIKGLLIATALLGELSKEGGFGDKAADKLSSAFGLTTNAKREVTPDDYRQELMKGGGTLEEAIKRLFGADKGGDLQKKLADNITAGMKAKGFDPSKGLEEFDKQLAKLNGTAKEGSEIALPKIKRNVDEVGKASEKAAKEAEKLAQKLKGLAQEFASSGEKASQGSSFTSSLGLFGEINRELADAFNLDAISAGNVQAADAIVRALERVENESFEYAKALGTVAQAYQSSSRVANTIVLALARAALQASQAAAAAVIGRPTREVADLGIPLAQSRLRESQINQRVNPQINALNNQLRGIDRAMRELDKAQRAADKARKQRENARKQVDDAQNRILEDQLDAQKRANLLARHNYERQSQQLEDLIDANKKAISELQGAFLKANEAMQREINKAIGKGDTGGALGLVEQQREATKRFRESNKGLDANGLALIDRQKALDRAEAERQRQAELAELELQETQKRIKNTQEDSEALAQHSEEVNDSSDAIDAQREKLEEQRQSIQEQIESLQGQKDAQSQVTQSIQDQIAVYEAQTEVLRAVAEAADQTLLTQEEQARLMGVLTEQIRIESGVVAGLTTAQKNLIPEVEQANLQFALLKDAIRILRDEGFRQTFINEGINPAAIRLSILAASAYEAGEKMTVAGNKVADAGERFSETTARAARDLSNLFKTLSGFANDAGSGRGGGGGGGGSFAYGGYTGSAGGTVHPHEWVIPAGKPARAREVIASMPPGMFQSAGTTSIGSIFGDLSVQGATLDDMRGFAITAVNDAFNKASRVGARSGSLITSGVSGSSGPGGGSGGVLAPMAQKGQGGYGNFKQKGT